MTFQPPVEIENVLRTDGQVRFGYAAGSIIFNWEINGSELRIDGGPARGQHRPGAGALPTNKQVTIRQVVREDLMTVWVEGRERARWSARFSSVKEPIRIWPVFGSTLQIKHVLVKKLR